MFDAFSVCFAPYWKNLIGFWEKRHQDNIIFLKYEDLKQNLPSEIQRLAKFLEVEITEEQMVGLQKHLSFESMKINPAVNYENIINDLNTKFNLIPKGTFMRAGKVGGYKGVMSQDLVQEFDRWTLKNVEYAELGY